MTARYLVDKSALARWDEPAVAAVLGAALVAGLLWSAPPVELEVRYSAQSPAEYATVARDRTATDHRASLAPEISVIALELLASLAAAGTLRPSGPRVADGKAGGELPAFPSSDFALTRR